MANDTNLHAPVLPIEYPANDQPIHACPFCLPWSVDIVRDHPHDGDVTVREWHAVGCQVLSDMTDGE